MKEAYTVKEILAQHGLPVFGPVSWGTPVLEKGSGVYLVSLEKDPSAFIYTVDISYLPEDQKCFWVPSQTILYIGRSNGLKRRIKDFYRHEFGEKRPHSGGQAIKLIRLPLWIFWTTTKNYVTIEDQLIKAFKARTGCRPFANRNR